MNCRKIIQGLKSADRLNPGRSDHGDRRNADEQHVNLTVRIATGTPAAVLLIPIDPGDNR